MRMGILCNLNLLQHWLIVFTGCLLFWALDCYYSYYINKNGARSCCDLVLSSKDGMDVPIFPFILYLLHNRRLTTRERLLQWKLKSWSLPCAQWAYWSICKSFLFSCPLAAPGMGESSSGFFNRFGCSSVDVELVSKDEFGIVSSNGLSVSRLHQQQKMS